MAAMPTFRFVLAGILVFAAVLCVVFGVVTEYRQSREKGPIARVPTLGWALQAAFAVGVALLIWPVMLEWWLYPLLFLGTLFGAGALIRLASARESCVTLREGGVRDA